MEAMTETAEEAAYFAGRDGEPAPEPVVETPETPAAPESAATEPAAAVTPPAAPVEPVAPPAGHVPIAALHEARAKQKAAETDAAALKQILARFQPPAQPVAPEPTIDDDPVAVLKRLEQRQIKFDEAQKAAHEEATVYRAGMSAIGEYARNAPDYADAIAYLEKSVRDEYDALGIPREQQEVIGQQQIMQTIRGALANGRNPGEIFHGLARARGFAPKPAAVAAPVAPALSPSAIVDQVANGRQQHKSLTGGAEPDAELSLSDAAKLEGAAFDKWWAKNAKRAMGA